MISITSEVIDFDNSLLDIEIMTSETKSPQTAFTNLLRTWRSRRRLSQLELALDAGLSQRHVSFLETGRSKPSRHTVLQLGEALAFPAAEVDAMLTAAGFATQSFTARWGQETRLAVETSIEHILKGHEPYPAISIDRMWNLLKANIAAQDFFMRFGATGNPNLLRELLQPGGIRSRIVNWDENARALIRLLELEVARRPNDTEAQNLLVELLTIPGVEEAVRKPVNDNPTPVLTIRFQAEDRVLNLFSMIATIGMSADAAIDDVRIETLLPADETTRSWFLKE